MNLIINKQGIFYIQSGLYEGKVKVNRKAGLPIHMKHCKLYIIKAQYINSTTYKTERKTLLLF